MEILVRNGLALSWRRSLSLQCKSIDWFLYDRDHHLEREMQNYFYNMSDGFINMTILTH